jgi:signal transduction histidine kinase
LHRIFEPFFTTRLGQGGSGLGLHIVHNIVGGVLGGQIKVDSTPGQGTEFRMTLPVVAPQRVGE